MGATVAASAGRLNTTLKTNASELKANFILRLFVVKDPQGVKYVRVYYADLRRLIFCELEVDLYAMRKKQ